MKLLSIVASLFGLIAACGTGGSVPLEQNSKPDTEPRIGVRGRVVDVRRDDRGMTVRVEGKREPDTELDAVVARVTRETRVAFEPSGRAATADDLTPGTLVEVRLTGPIAKSYPAQAAAAHVAIIEEASRDEPPFEGTVGIVDGGGRVHGTAILRAVRSARHEGFDRTVFEFDGEGLPRYHLEYVDRPVRQCGSGDAVPVAGDGWLHVRFDGAAAHTDAGEPTVGFREQHVNLPVLLELESICDFEAEVGWVLGVRSPNAFRALELSNPTRLVVDVRHTSS